MIRHNRLFCDRNDDARWEATTKDFDYRQEDCVDPEKFNRASSGRA